MKTFNATLTFVQYSRGEVLIKARSLKEARCKGDGSKIKRVTVDGQPALKLGRGRYRLAEKTGTHRVVVEMIK